MLVHKDRDSECKRLMLQTVPVFTMSTMPLNIERIVYCCMRITSPLFLPQTFYWIEVNI